LRARRARPRRSRASEVERQVRVGAVEERRSVDDITPVLRHGRPRRRPLPWHSADKCPSHLAPILAECVGKVKLEPQLEPQRRGREFSNSAPGSCRANVGGCLGPRHRLDGDAGECQLLASYLRHGTRRRAFPGARESEMGEDPLNDGRVLDRGDELHPPGAARTAQHVEVQRVFRVLCAPSPCPSPPGARGSRRLPVPRRGRGWG